MLDAFICQAESHPNAESYRNEEVKRWGRQGEGRVGVGKMKAGSAIESSWRGRGKADAHILRIAAIGGSIAPSHFRGENFAKSGRTAEVPQEGTLGGKGQAERGQESGAGGGGS